MPAKISCEFLHQLDAAERVHLYRSREVDGVETPLVLCECPSGSGTLAFCEDRSKFPEWPVAVLTVAEVRRFLNGFVAGCYVESAEDTPPVFYRFRKNSTTIVRDLGNGYVVIVWSNSIEDGGNGFFQYPKEAGDLIPLRPGETMAINEKRKARGLCTY